MRAASWRLVGEVKGGSWSRPSRPREDKHPTVDKKLYEVTMKVVNTDSDSGEGK